MWSSTSTTIDALVQVDDMPTWVRVSAVEALSVSSFTNDTVIHLAGGGCIHTETPVEDVVEKMAKAMKPRE